MRRRRCVHARYAVYPTKCDEPVAHKFQIVRAIPVLVAGGLFTPSQRPHMKLSHSLALFACTVAGVALVASAADAGGNWKEHCAKCHGEAGKGDTKMGRKLSISDLTDAKVQAKFTDEEALKAMKEGIKDKDGKVTMKPVENMSEADMKALVAYVRGLKK